MKSILKTSFIDYTNVDCQYDYEIGVDEAGRGPMFGRVYASAVILPINDPNFNYSILKDSKKFTSVKKIKEVAEYIKENALFWAVSYCEPSEIDDINIRSATHKCMHESIYKVIKNAGLDRKYFGLIDGNDFTEFTYYYNDNINILQHKCIKQGDNKYTSIAAASILAKVDRDDYIDSLCKTNPLLYNLYDIPKNKGYGTKRHMDALKKYGITEFHRKTFGICKKLKVIDLKTING